MDFREVIENRRTVRQFLDKSVEPAVLKRILAAGFAAPTWNHKRNWHYIVLGKGADKETVFAFAKKTADKFDAERYLTIPRPYPVTLGQKMYAHAMPRQFSMLAEAPVVVIPVFQARKVVGGSFSALNPFATVWCAIENIFLAATAEGLACSMRIPMDEEHEEVKRKLKVPATYRMPVFIGIGYADPAETPLEQAMPDWDKQVHFGSWK